METSICREVIDQLSRAYGNDSNFVVLAAVKPDSSLSVARNELNR
jgi:hypothetical protein